MKNAKRSAAWHFDHIGVVFTIVIWGGLLLNVFTQSA